MATATGNRPPAAHGRNRDLFADVVLLSTVVLFFLLAVGVGLLALQRSLH